MTGEDPITLALAPPSITPTQFSVGPAGERFPLPTADDYAAERKRLDALVSAQREAGREVVVVVRPAARSSW
ncbi:MAG: hypothetical protein H6Q86_1145 [candidate division NC10 bacterium]|nr:hypothetical protein [candidate division NC10 bacterium]